MSFLDKYKKIIQLVLFIIVSFLSIAIYFFPAEIGFNNSLQAAQIKRDSIATESSFLINRETDIIDLLEEELRISEELRELEKEAKKAIERVNKDDLKIHIPSVLISLEQNAITNKVELEIDYGRMVKPDSQNNNRDNSRLDTEEKSIRDREEEIIIEKIEDEEDEREIKDEHKIDSSLVIDSISIDGLKVTSIPLSVKGHYENIRTFILYLDNIDYLEPSFVDLNSGPNGEISGVILIHIFHEE